jgi:RimJ/RimL family protein N-acetyltransferase
MELLTPRLRLEPLEPRHASALFEGLRSERLYEHIAAAPPASVEALRERYTRLARRLSPDGTERWLNWAIFCLLDQRYIGYVQATVTQSGTATIAYVLFADAWGTGYASEAVSRMIEHLIDAHRVLELRATVDVRNRRSIALLERLGFGCVEIRKDAELIHGLPSDEAEYRRSAAPPEGR